jgi:hypothetical protein
VAKRPGGLRISLADHDVRCMACGAVIPRGTVMVAVFGPPVTLFAHDGVCPEQWRPRVIHGEGGRTDSSDQRPLFEEEAG